MLVDWVWEQKEVTLGWELFVFFFTDKMRSWSENLCRVLTVLRHVCIDRELNCTVHQLKQILKISLWLTCQASGQNVRCAVTYYAVFWFRCYLMYISFTDMQLLYCAVYGHYLNIICLRVVRVLNVLLLFVHFDDRIAFFYIF